MFFHLSQTWNPKKTGRGFYISTVFLVADMCIDRVLSKRRRLFYYTGLFWSAAVIGYVATKKPKPVPDASVKFAGIGFVIAFCN